MEYLAIVAAHHKTRMRNREVHKRLIHLAIIQHVLRVSSANHLIQRRLCDEDLPLTHEFAHLTEEKGEQQRADVRAIDIGVSHDDDAAVAEFRDVEVFADAALQRLNENANFFEAEHLVEARLLDVEELSAQRKDRLQDVIASALGASACRVTFNDEEFRAFYIIA